MQKRVAVLLAPVTMERLDGQRAYPTEARESIIVRALDALERERRASREGAAQAQAAGQRL